MHVSVIIPVYNAAEFVAEAVESALAQPEAEQVILVDDGSKDDSLAVCTELARKNPRIEVLRHPDGGNHGAAASRNLGIAAVRCEYVAFLDADDYYLPGRFRRAREIMTNDLAIDGVYDAIGTVYQDEQVGQWYRDERQLDLLTITKPVEPEKVFDALMDGGLGYFCTDGIVVRTSLFAKAGVFDTSLRMCEDTALWLKMSLVGRLAAGVLTEPVGMRRLHGNNTIYQGRHRNPRYAKMMAELMLKWGRERGLSSERLLLFVELLLNFNLGETPSDTPYAWRKLCEMWLFVRFAMRYPMVLRSRHYWSVVGATVGWKRWKALCGQGAHALSRT